MESEYKGKIQLLCVGAADQSKVEFEEKIGKPKTTYTLGIFTRRSRDEEGIWW